MGEEKGYEKCSYCQEYVVNPCQTRVEQEDCYPPQQPPLYAAAEDGQGSPELPVLDVLEKMMAVHF